MLVEFTQVLMSLMIKETYETMEKEQANVERTVSISHLDVVKRQ